MPGQFGFTSPGGMAGNAIQQFLMQRELENRQRMMDELLRQNQVHDNQAQDSQQLLQRDQETRIAEAQSRSQSDLEQEREFRRAGTIAENALPDDPVDDPTRALLGRQGFGGQVRQVPGILMQGPMPDGEERPSSPESFAMRGGSKFLNQRATEDARAEQAAGAEAGRNERATADRELKEMIARASLSGNAESRALANELKRLQISMMGDKVDAAATERADKSTATTTTRATVRDLAQGLIDDAALGSITGPVEGRRESFWQGENTDALRRFNQLAKSLALTERSKLKGQGTITDYEAKMLEGAVSALERSAGPDIVKKHLQAIVDTFQGDAPNAGPATGGGGGRVYYDENGNPVSR